MGAKRSTTLILAAVLAVAVALLAGCGEEEDKLDIVEGEPVELGELEYNVLFSRFLNPYDVEDEPYLEGQEELGPDELWFGAFVQIENHGEEAVAIPSEFVIVDSAETEYPAVESESLYALPLGEEIDGGGKVPEIDSTPEVGPIEGSLILFRISQGTAENRPLKLVIEGEEGPAEVELDL
jgi:hypothetical protein